ncbi:MAG: CoA-binding protein [Spirochaetes bacterium]|nr:CoA-binding protein [Spirochaetota bacterium]
MDQIIKNIFQMTKTIAVVGLSPNPVRSSNHVASYLKHQGYQIIPVYPRLDQDILGEKVYKELKNIPCKVDTVVIFRKAKYTPELVEQAFQIEAKAAWLQEGIVSRQAEKIASDKGLLFVMDRCMLKEHLKYS